MPLRFSWFLPLILGVVTLLNACDTREETAVRRARLTSDLASGTAPPIQQDMGAPVQDMGASVQDMGASVQDMGSPVQDMAPPVQDMAPAMSDTGTPPPVMEPACWAQKPLATRQLIDALIVKLGDPDYYVREQAQAQLAAYCPDDCYFQYFDYRRGQQPDAEIAERLRRLAVACNNGCDTGKRLMNFKPTCHYVFPVDSQQFPAPGATPSCQVVGNACRIELDGTSTCSREGTFQITHPQDRGTYVLQCANGLKVHLEPSLVRELADSGVGCPATATLPEAPENSTPYARINFPPQAQEFAYCPADGSKQCTDELAEDVIQQLLQVFKPKACEEKIEQAIVALCADKHLLEYCN
jgi:hypothetical protein